MNLVGYTIDKQCPNCKQKLFRNGNNDEWCTCGYASDKSLGEFIRQMKRISKYVSSKSNH